MLMQIGQKPESDFNEPIGMLEDCHKRIFFFLRTLQQVAASAARHELDDTEHLALEKSLRYFREAAPRHTADEEESLFPRLRSIDTPEVRAALQKIEQIEQDHVWAEAQHREVDRIANGWCASGRIGEQDLRTLMRILDGLLTHYEHHIAVEESEVFSLAKGNLPADVLQSIGLEMASRRGIRMEERDKGLS